MGTSESACRSIGPSCCTSAPPVRIQTLSDTNPQAAQQRELDLDSYGCTTWSHVESLLAHLPPDVKAALEDEAFQARCHKTFQEIQKTSRDLRYTGSSGFLEGDQLIEAVHRSVPEKFLRDRLHETHLEKLILAFDTDCDGRVTEEEFDLFCMWAVAMEVMGFFAGTTPFATIADVIGQPSSTKLLIVSEFLDPDHNLEKCALPETLCAYYHPDGITIDEFSAQIESAAHLRSKSGKLFQSVALANHGPDEEGLWNVCSDHPVSLQSTDTAWPRLMPLFRALAAMVEDPGQKGCVDILACNFAATPAGRGCIQMIEQKANARFSASTDETGNVAEGGNWVLELGERNVAPVYFQEEKLHHFSGVMAPASRQSRQSPRQSGVAARGSCQSRQSGVLHGKHDHHHSNDMLADDYKAKASRASARAKPPARKKKEELRDTLHWQEEVVHGLDAVDGFV